LRNVWIPAGVYPGEDRGRNDLRGSFKYVGWVLKDFIGKGGVDDSFLALFQSNFY
jgi:hypothetical protein